MNNVFKITLDNNNNIKIKLYNEIIIQEKSELVINELIETVKITEKLTNSIIENYSKEENETLEVHKETDLFILGYNRNNEFNNINININKTIFKKINNKKLTIFKYINEEFLKTCEKLLIMLSKYIDKNINTILKIKLILMLNGSINLNITTDLSNEIFYENFISLKEIKEIKEVKEIYEAKDFRPIFRNLFFEIQEYCNYLIALIGEKEILNTLKNPQLFTITLYNNCNYEILFEEQFRKILEKYLNFNDIQYYLSELYILINEILEELTYIMKTISKISNQEVNNI